MPTPIIRCPFKMDSDQNSTEMIAVKNIPILRGTSPSSGYDGLAGNLPGWQNVTFILQSAIDGNDEKFPFTAGHELGHPLFDVGNSGHITDAKNLFHSPTSRKDTLGPTKRFTDNQNKHAGNDSGPKAKPVLLQKK